MWMRIVKNIQEENEKIGIFAFMEHIEVFFLYLCDKTRKYDTNGGRIG